MDISLIVQERQCRGVMAIGDIHNQSSQLLQAIQYADDQGLFIVLLGDMFDGGDDPIGVANIVLKLLNSGKAAFTIGNHDDKMYRYALGNKVKVNDDMQDTLEKIGPSRMAGFMKTTIEIVEHHMSGLLHTYGDAATFTHAAVHKSLWEDGKMHSAARAMCLYGEVDGTRDSRGFPIRTYNWVTHVPSGHYVVVGHDRTALDKPHTVPSILTNTGGGFVIFSDTSCGKEQNGPLTGVIFGVEDGLGFITFKAFTGQTDETVP